uniref:Rho guanine nucleotide exchange factor 38 n=1 Tax=Mustela putorius furo TaxID=9669 RepID=M3YC74_MUSPF
MQEGKPNLLDMGSLMIKPIQRVMKYPLLLCELRGSTPPSHPDFRALGDAFTAVKDVNVNINELKRRKDLVLKYKRNDEEESLKDKLSKLNIHSISKKSKRVTNHLKILTRGEPQVKDNTFNREEKLFRSLEKTVRHCMKNITLCHQHIQDYTCISLSRAVSSVWQFCINESKRERETFLQRNHKMIKNQMYSNYAAHLQRLVLMPLSALLSLFTGPQKLIQKRYDKLLDCNSSLPRVAGDETDLAKKEYEALNAQLVEELQVFNQAARKILWNCLCSFMALLRDLTLAAQQVYSTVAPNLFLLMVIWMVPQLDSRISEIQNRVLEEVQNLNFVKDNSATFIERKLSFEKKKSVQILVSLPEVPRQTDIHRSKLLSTYGKEELYQAKRKCNATQEYDINLLEGELVAVVEQKDPLGSTSRWLVDTGIIKGYVYSSFLKPYNPAKVQKVDTENRFGDDDFDNISLFVSSRPATDSVTGTPESSISDSSSSLSGTCGKFETNGTDVDSSQEVDEQVTITTLLSCTQSEAKNKVCPKTPVQDRRPHRNISLNVLIPVNRGTWASGFQAFPSIIGKFLHSHPTQKAWTFSEYFRISLSDDPEPLENNGEETVGNKIFYAVHAFQARSDHELSLQEYQRVHILRFCDLSGNKEWWLAEAQGQKGYVPANYLGKMTYA